MRSIPSVSPRSLLALLGLMLLAATTAPSIAAASECLVPHLPRIADPAAVRAQLQAEGRWQKMNDPALTPPDDPQVGDNWLWYVWDLGGFPVADLKPATVRGMGDHCYVVVDDEEWNVTMDQADVDRIVEHFDQVSVGQFSDQGIWDLNTSHYGMPPDFDGLERIFLFYYRFDISADGYFWIYDQFPDGTQPFASNEADVVYLATDSGDPSSNYMMAVGAHEFTHLIMYASDANEALWAEEGMGELAMWLFGRPDTISSFNSDPDNSLINWGGAWADYIQTYLWTLYAYERFGGQPFIYALSQEPADGLAGYRNVIDALDFRISTADLFDQWSVANFLDDTAVDQGQYGYEGDDLPPFNTWRIQTGYPVEDLGSVQSYATDYVRLLNLTDAPTISIDGSDGAEWRVTLIARDDAAPTLVQPINLDADHIGSLTFDAATGHDEVIISVANVSETSNGLYVYEVTEGVTDATLPRAPVAVSVAPNPFNPRTELRFGLTSAGHARLSIHRADGARVRTLVNGTLAGGEHAATWLGRDDAGRELASGTYLARLEAAGTTTVSKLALVR
jgi:hypothetical protein